LSDARRCGEVVALLSVVPSCVRVGMMSPDQRRGLPVECLSCVARMSVRATSHLVHLVRRPTVDSELARTGGIRLSN